MHSCIYEGRVEHRRVTPVNHDFRYRIYLLYLDLDELPAVLGSKTWLHGSRFAPAAFCRDDHLGEQGVPLADAVRELVFQQAGFRPSGAIRLLTQLRNWGYYFSPISLYYCYGQDGERVEAVVAEVSNTPWLERHCYVLLPDAPTADKNVPMTCQHAKAFHVSPFMGMDMRYDWRLTLPASRLCVAISGERGGRSIFRAALALKRRELTRSAMFQTLVRYPWMTGRIVQTIYWQAFKLWWQKCPYVPKPSVPKASLTDEAQPS